MVTIADMIVGKMDKNFTFPWAEQSRIKLNIDIIHRTNRIITPVPIVVVAILLLLGFSTTINLDYINKNDQMGIVRN